MNTRPTNLPAELPDPPNPPDGMMWEYQGMGWKSDSRTIFAYYWDHDDTWVISSRPENASGNIGHYLEAVPAYRDLVAGVDVIEPIDEFHYHEEEWRKTRCAGVIYQPGPGKHFKHRRPLTPATTPEPASEAITGIYLNEAADIIRDMLKGDDGDAWKYARRFLEKLEPRTTDDPVDESITPDHYAGSVTPWDLQRCMKSSGNLFVDSRRTDAIEYCFRMKGDLLADLIKARHCIDAAIGEMRKAK